MDTLPWILIAIPVAFGGYAFFGYPLALRVARRIRSHAVPVSQPADWPLISISVPVYNEEAQIRGLIESLLQLDYPADRRQILVISDASTDRTDEIVAEYADRGVEFLRMPTRGGKTAAEHAGAVLLRGDIVINTDASIRIRPDALKPLIAQFADPTIGVASGRDVSVGSEQSANVGEGGYVGYEMEVRALETQVEGIVGASGCFYAIRNHLHREFLPESLSRDFAAALITKRRGFRSVSVDSAVCLVPRTGSLRKEYRRKVRTITRGMETLWHLRALMNPVRYGVFAWMLFSHKVCRWLVPWGIVPLIAGLVMLATDSRWALLAQLALFGVLASLAVAAIGWFLDGRRALPRWIAVPAFAWAANLAAIHAGLRALAGDQNATWEPTRRDVMSGSPGTTTV